MSSFYSYNFNLFNSVTKAKTKHMKKILVKYDLNFQSQLLVNFQSSLCIRISN